MIMIIIKDHHKNTSPAAGTRLATTNASSSGSSPSDSKASVLPLVWLRLWVVDAWGGRGHGVGVVAGRRNVETSRRLLSGVCFLLLWALILAAEGGLGREYGVVVTVCSRGAGVLGACGRPLYRLE